VVVVVLLFSLVAIQYLPLMVVEPHMDMAMMGFEIILGIVK
jgi:hypothetical protein